MSAKGLEPLTNGLKGHCSAIELRARRDEFYHDRAEASTGLVPANFRFAGLSFPWIAAFLIIIREQSSFRRQEWAWN